MSQSLNRRLTDWERRWAPAHHWSSLIFYQKFRQEVTDYVFDINSNRRYYRSESPGSVSYNYCPRCAAGQQYNYLFFHPAVADLFLAVVKSLDMTKRKPELSKIEVQSCSIAKLPDLFGRLGHPCQIGEYGAVWSCIMDKLDQSFPYECLLMVDNCRHMELYKENHISDSESDCDTDIDELEDRYFGIQSDGFHDSFM